MVTTADGILSSPEDAMIALLAALPAFRAWCGAASEAEAAARCHTDAVPADADYPYVLLGIQEHETSSATPPPDGDYDERGAIYVAFCQLVAEAAAGDFAEAERRFKNAVGAILGALRSLAGTDGKLNVVATRMIRPNSRYRHGDVEDDLGAEQRIEFLFYWEY